MELRWLGMEQKLCRPFDLVSFYTKTRRDESCSFLVSSREKLKPGQLKELDEVIMKECKNYLLGGGRNNNWKTRSRGARGNDHGRGTGLITAGSGDSNWSC